MNSMLFTCGGMRQGKHHLFDELNESNQGLHPGAQATFKQMTHKRIQESFGGTLSKNKPAQDPVADFDEVDDIRDEDFDDE